MTWIERFHETTASSWLRRVSDDSPGKGEYGSPHWMRTKAMKIEFKPGNRWDLINALNVGASKTLCVRHPEYYDPRPYGVALLEAYPSLKDNALGRGTDAALQLLLDGIANRS